MKIKYIFSFLILFFCLSSCSELTTNDIPGWVLNKITEFQNEPAGNPPQSIWEYTYRNQKVYYIPPQCCDQFSFLYDINGNLICAPDGGFTGRGDERCTDFFELRKDEKLIWQDKRIK